MTSSTKTHLLVIDPQNDFCDIPVAQLPEDPSGANRRLAPSLPVAGAHADMERLAQFIQRQGHGLAHIHVTLDSHNPWDIAHPAWWVDTNGYAPPPFTVITGADIATGLWRARDPHLQSRSRRYVEQLEAAQRYALVVWPEHCLVGQWGHNVHAGVAQALGTWGRSQGKVVDYVHKGSNPFTEHYSAVRAEVPDAQDPSTQLNQRLLANFAQADQLLVAGEALAHCVANTVRDIAEQFGAHKLHKIVLLTDCSSSVGGFEALGQAFVAEMCARGMQTARSTEVQL